MFSPTAYYKKNTSVRYVNKLGDEWYTEQLVCEETSDDCYIITSIPEFAPNLAVGDTIEVEWEERDQAYYFGRRRRASGNSTVHIALTVPSQLEPLKAQLDLYVCQYEYWHTRRYLAVNVPKANDFSPLHYYLTNGEKNNYWKFITSCKAHVVIPMRSNRLISAIDQEAGDLLTAIGKNLFQLRQNRNADLQQVSYLLGIDPVEIQQIEQGLSASIGMGSFLRLCCYYGLGLSAFLEPSLH